MVNMALRQSFRTKYVSKYKHVFGRPAKKDVCYEGVRITKNAWDSNFCAVNPKFLAVVVEAQGGGPFLVVPLDCFGRIPIDYPKVTGHKGPVLDLQWNPFDDNTLASASEDCTIKIWFIPDGGLTENLKDYIGNLCGHERKVGIVRWHPCASNIIASAGFDNNVIVWDVEREAAVLILKGHPETIYSLSYNWNGSLIATTCKDKKIRVIDPREGKLVACDVGHKGPKGSQVTFLGNTNRLFTVGFSRMNTREIKLWDLGNGFEKPLKIEVLDSSSGLLMSYYDPDTRMMYLAGKGDGNIRYYEILDEEPFLYFLSEYRSAAPQRGHGLMPKRGLDVSSCEVMRFYKLHNNGVIEPISMIVPRRDSGTIHFDLFPKTCSNRPALTASDWLNGATKGPLQDDLLDGMIGDGMSRESYESTQPVKRREEQVTPMQNDVSYSEPKLVNGNKGGFSRPSNDYNSWDLETLRVAYGDLQEEVQSLKVQVKVRDSRIDKLEREHKYYSEKLGF